MIHWVWIEESVVLAIHQEQLAEHGGAVGIRDKTLLESALARSRNVVAYLPAGEVDAATLAAAMAFGIIKNHPFLDGNKRTGYVLLEVFLLLNGYELTAEDTDCVTAIMDVASGAHSEAELALWIRSHMRSKAGDE